MGERTNGGAAVARLFGGVPDHVPPGRIGPWCREIFGKRSNLLQQNDLRPNLLHDFRKSFFESAFGDRSHSTSSTACWRDYAVGLTSIVSLGQEKFR